mmetsp:Transcript_31608/g.69245  ORF Transcript_31608/g.69245 Transcript_31608/m.69245 type:complete len:102 (+) Transcript_31608:148-453(+)
MRVFLTVTVASASWLSQAAMWGTELLGDVPPTVHRGSLRGTAMAEVASDAEAEVYGEMGDYEGDGMEEDDGLGDEGDLDDEDDDVDDVDDDEDVGDAEELQ